MSKFLRWIVNIVLIVAIAVTCGLLVPPLAGVTTVIVDDVDMLTNLDRGSVTYGMPKSLNELALGDDILVQDVKGDYQYRIKEIDASTGECELEDIKSTDSQARTETFTKEVPKVLFTVPFIGYVTMAMKSTEGLIIIGLAVIFIIILFILSELWKKDGEEDYEDEEAEEEKAPVAPVDISAQILEEVSSEIGSEVLNVIAQDADQAEITEAANVTEVLRDKGLMGDTVPIEDVKESQDSMVKEIEKAIAAGADEKSKTASIDEDIEVELADEAKVTKEEMVEMVKSFKEAAAEEALVTKEATTDKSEVVDEQEEEQPAKASIEEDLSKLEPVEMAMPIHTVEELIQEAKEAGHDPEVEKDEDLGITILDYSKLL